MKKGVFIVIDGTDGSGKKTQTDLLAERLKLQSIAHTVFDFPQYKKPSSYFVEQYLNGKYGTIEEVNSYAGSLFFALDRYDAGFTLRSFLESGTSVISNRYVSSNMGHQGAKMIDAQARKIYLDWLYDIEFVKLGIPKPDVTLILHVAADVGQGLVDAKGHRDYVQGTKRDLHEESIDHLRAAEQVYLEIAHYPGFKLIECMDGNSMRTREEIRELIWKEVEPMVQRL